MARYVPEDFIIDYCAYCPWGELEDREAEKILGKDFNCEPCFYEEKLQEYLKKEVF